MEKFLTVLCIILVWGIAALAHGAVVDMKQFGQCVVGTEGDDFTDEKSPRLRCVGQGNNLGSYAVTLMCLQQDFVTGLEAGIRVYLNETIDILYRFDKGQLSKGSWGYSKNFAASFDKSVHNRFVDGIEKAKTLFFKVGDEASSVDLKGSASAVTEYKKRCSALARPL